MGDTLPERGFLGLSRPCDRRAVFFHAGRQDDAIVAGEFMGDPGQLLPVMREIDRFNLIGPDAGSDDVAVLMAVVVSI
jgi:hypothetical protein